MPPRFPAVLAVLLALAAPSRGDELAGHIAAQKKQIDDPDRPMIQRERLAVELAATLDRAARGAADDEVRHARWAEAAAVLGDFNKHNPGHPEAGAFALQSGVYLWALGRDLAQIAELSPQSADARSRAMKGLDEAVARLREAEKAKVSPDSALGQNLRYRLAQALADRAVLQPPGSVDRHRDELDAAMMVDRPIADRALHGYAELLHADVRTRLGQYDQAAAALDRADAAEAPPRPAERLEARVALELARKQPDAAWKAVEAAPKDDPTARRLALRVRLAQREAAADPKRRADLEADAFRRAAALRKDGGADGRLALIELARTLEEPGPDQGPEAWDTLAEGRLLLGQPDRAAALAEAGADRAGPSDRGRDLRYRAGAILFQAGRFAEADEALAPVADDPKAGPIRPRASLLRVLARGRLVDRAPTPANREAYAAALERHLAAFPDDPTTAEVRYRLGRLRLDAGRPADASALWASIPPGSPRRLDARLAAAELLAGAVEVQRLGGDTAAIEAKMEAARSALAEVAREQSDAPGRAEVDLARAALELMPGVGRPAEAREIAGRVARDATRADLRRRALLLGVAALAATGRYVEADAAWRPLANEATPGELLALARRLDRLASATSDEGDLVGRRIGPQLRSVATRLLELADDLSADEAAEARLRMARAIAFSGDAIAARRSVSRWPGHPANPSEDFLRDLADLYVRIGASDLAVDVFRLLQKRQRPGTLPWFASRLGLAAALERSGEVGAARSLIDATSILHPDLGGGELKTRFERLRKRLGPG